MREHTMEAYRPIGSTFAWHPPSGECAELPVDAKLYATGRGALLAACRQIPSQAAVWLPSYFPGDVVEAISGGGRAVQIYEDLPTEREPEWTTLTPSPGDIVVAVNFFGVRDPAPWNAWRNAVSNIALIEDHTHDPLSTWAKSSTADYAFASLRKTLPLADGAALWSPRQRPLPSPTGSEFSPAAAYALAGMILQKSYCEAGGDEQLCQAIRTCQNRSEELLSLAGAEPISNWSRQYLIDGIPTSHRRGRETNTRQFLDAVRRTNRLAGCVPIFRHWPAGHCPFHPILLFDTRQQREACRASLARHRLVGAACWPVSRWMSPRAADVASRALTIPLDHRCDAAHYSRVIDLLGDSLAETKATRPAA